MFSLLKTWFGGEKPSPSRRPGRPSVRLSLESLEDRFLPSTLNVIYSSDANTPGTLRYAVNQASLDSQHGQSDTIVFAKSFANGFIILNSPMVLNGGKGTITINGDSAPGLTIDCNHKCNAFGVTGNTTAVINGLDIKNGHYDRGGAISNGGTLTLNHCKFDNDAATSSGGAISNSGHLVVNGCTFTGDTAGKTTTMNSYSGYGGAIFNTGTTDVDGCWFQEDFAGYGGAIYNNQGGTLLVNGSCEFLNNHALKDWQVGCGGAIFNGGSAKVFSSTFNNNSAANDGGAIANIGNIDVENQIYFSENEADYGGGFYSSDNNWTLKVNHWEGDIATQKGPNYYILATGKAG